MMQLGTPGDAVGGPHLSVVCTQLPVLSCTSISALVRSEGIILMTLFGGCLPSGCLFHHLILQSSWRRGGSKAA
jgi:hypothetical protein